jgi:hypothetical protein
MPLAAVVIGSLSPDFEYFVRLAPRGRLLHTPVGLMCIAVPVSILVWAFFRGAVRPALLGLLPSDLAGTIRSRRHGLGAVVVAVCLGAWSHVGWDGFTHASGWAVRAWPQLQRDVFPGLVPALPWFKLLQHISSLIGLFALTAWAACWVSSQSSRARLYSRDELRRTLPVVALVLMLAIVGAVSNALRVPSFLSAAALGYGTVGAGVGAGLAVAAASVWTTAGAWQANRRLRRIPPDERSKA